MTERILIVGGGAIGGVAAAHLVRAGRDVVVLDADQQHVARLTGPGLLLEDVDGTHSRVVLPAASSADQLEGPFDFALVTLKSQAVLPALTPLVERALVDTYVSLGNGLIQDRVESIVGRDRLVVGVVEWGATNLGPGHLRQTTHAPMVVGELDGATTARLERLHRILRNITPDARTTSTIGGQVWSKLLLNSTFSGLGTVGGCVYGDVAADPVGRQAALRLWTEGYDIARAQRLPLVAAFGVDATELVVREGEDTAAAEAALDRFMIGAHATKASMLQDLERSVRTEVDVINGGVVRTATRLGRQSPLNAEVIRIVHEYEAGTGRPGREAFRRVLAQAAGARRHQADAAL